MPYAVDPQWVQEIIKQYGPAIGKLVTDAINSGFTKAFIVECLDTLGPIFLQIAISMLGQQNLAKRKSLHDALETLVDQHRLDNAENE